jgi:hypothetical protein
MNADKSFKVGVFNMGHDGSFQWSGNFIDATIKFEPTGGDSNRVTITFEQPANGIEQQTIQISRPSLRVAAGTVSI